MTEGPSAPDVPGADPTPTAAPPVPAGAAGAPAEWQRLPEVLQTMAERLARLESRFDDKIKNDAAREAIVQRLHSEVQEYRTDLLLKVLRPVLLDLISLHDEMSQALASPGPEDAGSSRERAERLLARFQQEVVDILYRQGVECFVQEGEQFDPRRQRANRTLPAPAPEREGQIAARLRPGFATGERILRPELVAVYVRGGAANTPDRAAAVARLSESGLPPATPDSESRATADPSNTGDPRA
jgi:molecular chaperone GrpE